MKKYISIFNGVDQTANVFLLGDTLKVSTDITAASVVIVFSDNDKVFEFPLDIDEKFQNELQSIKDRGLQDAFLQAVLGLVMADVHLFIQNDKPLFIVEERYPDWAGEVHVILERYAIMRQQIKEKERRK